MEEKIYKDFRRNVRIESTGKEKRKRSDKRYEYRMSHSTFFDVEPSSFPRLGAVTLHTSLGDIKLEIFCSEVKKLRKIRDTALKEEVHQTIHDVHSIFFQLF